MSDLVIHTLTVNDATVSLIKAFVIPDLILKSTQFKADASFLASIETYSQYYRDLEQNGKKQVYTDPLTVKNLGPLLPIPKKHALHSYWRYFRLTMEKSQRGGLDCSELFSFLPLLLNLPPKKIAVNGRKLTAEITAYLFPFGACVITMDVNVSNVLFLDIVDLSRNLKGSNILNDITYECLGTFDGVTRNIAKDIASNLVEPIEPIKNPLEFDTFKFVFIKKTDTPLSEFADLCKKAIAAIITGQTLQNLLSQDDKTVETNFKVKMHRHNPEEILIYHDKGALVYPDPEWLKTVEKRDSATCMQNNYQSCLVFLFAIRWFIYAYSQLKQAGIDSTRLAEFKKASSCALLQPAGTLSKIYFDHVFSKIASYHGLDKAIAEVMK